MSSKNRRNLLRLCVRMAVLLCVVLTPFLICSAAETPRRGGTLVVPIFADLPTLNPALTTLTQQVLENIFDSLVELDRHLEPLPGLAESWDISPDGLTITFHLVKNVKWHDGRPFTSKDVQFSLMEVVGKYHARGKEVMANVGSIETPDNNTVVFHMKSVYAPLLIGLATRNCPIIPRHIFEGTDILKNPHNLSNPIGTGAFKFKEWVRGDHITLVRNENYRRPGLPYLDKIIFKVMIDPSTRILAFEKGEVDLLDYETCPYEDYKRLSSLPNIKASPPFGDPRVILIAFNQKDNKTLANLMVRQAIYHAIDRKFICDKVRYGLNPPLHSPIPSSIRDFYNPNVKNYEYSPTKANKLLDEAGYPRKGDGMRFSVGLNAIIGQPSTAKVTQALKPMLREAGIDLKLEHFELSVVVEKVFKKYEFDMHVQDYSTGGDPAIGIARCYVSSAIRPEGWVNVARYSNLEVDRLFAEAAATMDRKKRARAYYKVQEILTEDLPYIWLFERAYDTNLIKSEFMNCFQKTYSPQFTEVWWRGGK